MIQDKNKHYGNKNWSSNQSEQVINNNSKFNTDDIQSPIKLDTGFTLIYNESLDLKKLDNRSLTIFHKTLKRNSSVKLTNPLNKKSLIATVKTKDNFSNFSSPTPYQFKK